jgi:c-di-GMP-binding flagellar brake protein YcgR
MTLRVPIVATANQTLSVTLAGQFCKITIVQRDGNVYLSLDGEQRQRVEYAHVPQPHGVGARIERIVQRRPCVRGHAGQQ